MGAQQVFLRQLSACHDENHWFACLQQALAGVNEAQANWKERVDLHSIHEIVNHLITYNGRCLDRFQGEPVPPIEERNEDTFVSGTEMDWEVTVATITTIMDDWMQVIQETEEWEWEQQISEYTDETWAMMVANMVIHTGYHIGQIVMLRKQQNVWDVEAEMYE
ncbi:MULTISPECIES: DinB family protein [Geomicrobium]|uniref:Damage-inducible protein DinB n=1 Tax=Geomicrobium sediminis TaxID=1347788 RepID=A0ABS2PC92_9BACL|nr:MULTISPECIES: DinB family protein [Geomicrobium]MBM7632907.1 putative damage-inducible protein DinB [Geomicrobium sediminis]GAJ98007.1 hypothetical protein JCM19055_908 [Geomicrobium sp. JCM 19055]GAK10360.1 hypothetical protein JCM19038_4265 [Geomicrobium sp. JCM 19038]